MNNTKINLEYIEQFNPCKEGVDRFIKAGYANYNGNIIDFIKLDKIPFTDIKWVIFHEDQKILSDNLMREFDLLCALRAVEKVSIPEITYFYDIGLLEYISGEKINYTANYAANYASRSASRSAAYYAAEENIQKEILVDLIENGLVIMPEWS